MNRNELYREYLISTGESPLPEEADVPVIEGDYDSFLQNFVEPEPAPQPAPQPGMCYLASWHQPPFEFILGEKVDDAGRVRVWKITRWLELTRQDDMFIHLDDEQWAVETTNSFYLTKDEIDQSHPLGVVRNTSKIIEALEKGEIPADLQGFHYPPDDRYVQNLFHQKEEEIICGLKFRNVETTILHLPLPGSVLSDERWLLPAAASEESAGLFKEQRQYGENFTLVWGENRDLLLIPDPDINGRECTIHVFDREVFSGILWPVMHLGHFPEVTLSSVRENISINLV